MTWQHAAPSQHSTGDRGDAESSRCVPFRPVRWSIGLLAPAHEHNLDVPRVCWPVRVCSAGSEWSKWDAKLSSGPSLGGDWSCCRLINIRSVCPDSTKSLNHHNYRTMSPGTEVTRKEKKGGRRPPLSVSQGELRGVCLVPAARVTFSSYKKTKEKQPQASRKQLQPPTLRNSLHPDLSTYLRILRVWFWNSFSSADRRRGAAPNLILLQTRQEDPETRMDVVSSSTRLRLRDDLWSVERDDAACLATLKHQPGDMCRFGKHVEKVQACGRLTRLQ